MTLVSPAPDALAGEPSTPGPTAPCLPAPRGTLGAAVHDTLLGSPDDAVSLPPASSADDEAQTLWVLQELHYRGFAGVDDRWEWHPDLLAVRVRLERDLEQRLRERWAAVRDDYPAADEVADPDRLAEAVFAMTESHDGPSLAAHLQRHGTTEQALDMLAQKSVYHLKEADPTAWVVPRLTTAAKAPLAEIQYDEYGAGDPAALHHHLYERGMRAAGLDADYGAYVGEAVPEILEQNAAMTMLGLHRRLRGAALGHFAAFEASSSLPSQRLARALRKLGLPEEVAAYYDEHVEADAAHEQVAVRAVCGALVAEEPHLAEDVLLGAWTCLDLEARVGTSLLQRWAS
ncbi:iron-containing redox enzyme family protein [Nocardioidaceae bacterium]|nr:iron-containing redox enzyme family protein [Nocardioidaceae bacterium]